MKPATLRMVSWENDPPMIGTYMKTPKGHTAYLVLGITYPKKPCGYAFRLTCERMPASMLKSDDIVHRFYWMKR